MESPLIKANPSLLWRLKWNTRFGRWASKPLRCKLGRHRQDDASWGFGGAVIDWYCRGCERQIGQTPIDDATPEMLDQIGVAQKSLGIAP